MKIWMISLNDMPGPISTTKDGLLAMLDGEIEGLEVGNGDQLQITVGEMTQEAYDALPEFGGW